LLQSKQDEDSLGALAVKDNEIDSVATTAWLVSVLCFGLQSAAFAGSEARTFSGNASWYGMPFHGKKTASGEIFDMYKLSGAHRTLPMLTKVLVENPKTGKSTIVKVNDRGPYVKTRVMDLSRQGAFELGYLSSGTAFIDCTVVGKGGGAAQSEESPKPSSDETDKKDSTGK